MEPCKAKLKSEECTSKTLHKTSYVAAFISSMLYLVWYLLPLTAGSDRE